MKKILLVSVLLLGSLSLAQERTVSIPESQLTEQQKQALKLQQVDSTVEKAHGWVGIGKELGQAFDSAMGSLTIRSNEFASTPVGRFTMFIVAWKVMGEQAVQALNAAIHILWGAVEVVIFVPFFLWSYRRSCMTRRVILSQEGPFWKRTKTWKLIEYEYKKDFTPRWGHAIAALAFMAIWAFTTFSY